MKEIIASLLSVGLAAFFVFVALAAPVSAVDVLQESCSGGGGSSAICDAGGDDLNDIWANIVSALVFIIGAIAVIMIIIGAIRYTTSNGDQSQLTSAKNTILYAIVGLILAIAAGGIINFVLERFA